MIKYLIKNNPLDLLIYFYNMYKLAKKNTTLDSKHNDMLKFFQTNENILIPKYKKDINKLENSINSNSKSKNIESLQNKIQYLKNEIYKLEKIKNDYYLNNSKYIFDYFEEKKNINIKTDEITNTNINISKKKIENFFFSNCNNNQPNIEIKNSNNVDKYFYNIDNTQINYDDYCFNSDICNYCNIGEMIYIESDGVCVCNNCSKTVKYLIDNEKPSYKEPPKEVCFYAYKRINHLKEILAQFQAKESTYIPQEVFDNIKNQIKKERIQTKDLTNKKTKELLKNLGYNKYYEHIPFIKDKLGIKPPNMSPELEETLCNLFMEIQKPYSKFCPKERVNFLNYYYTLYKLCELLNEDKFLPYFPMLKDREKRIEQDQIWKKICEELNWKFIPTI